MPKGKKHDYLLRVVVGPLVPLPDALGRLPLPLPRGIVTADVSLGVNEATWGSSRGGGWESKKREVQENKRMRGVGSIVIP